MSAGMAEVIWAHNLDRDGECDCQKWSDVTHVDHPAHVAEELTKAGYGDVPAALLAAADEMPVETLAGADKASVWLRHRAHSQDPEGHALVKAIHDRKAEGPPDHALWCRGGHEGTCQRGRASGTEA